MVAMHTMQGKDVLITGGTAGIGRAAAEALARLGASVTVIGRDAGRCRTAAEEITRAAGAGKVEGLACDLGSHAEVRRAAASFAASHTKLDVLALNAGVFLAKRELSADGFERTFAMGYLGHVWLTEALLPLLQASGDGRVVTTAAPPDGMMKVNFDDPLLERSYSTFRAVPNAKAALVMYTLDLADRMAGKGVTANLFHPGVVSTNLASQMPWVFDVMLRTFGASPAKGADTLVYLASSPEAKGRTGTYFHKRQAKPIAGQVVDRLSWGRLRDLTARLTAQIT